MYIPHDQRIPFDQLVAELLSGSTSNNWRQRFAATVFAAMRTKVNDDDPNDVAPLMTLAALTSVALEISRRSHQPAELYGAAQGWEAHARGTAELARRLAQLVPNDNPHNISYFIAQTMIAAIGVHWLEDGDDASALLLGLAIAWHQAVIAPHYDRAMHTQGDLPEVALMSDRRPDVPVRLTAPKS